jgi:tripartite-type tricarboxylate transporter receptor subunit TctC
MKRSRRSFLGLVLGAAAVPAASRFAWGQTYPAKPVRIIVAFAAGGPPDIMARLMAQWLSERLGQQFVVENRPGGGGNIGTEAAVRAPADGYTLLLAVPANVINEALYDKLNFNFIRDIAPVASFANSHYVVVVHPSLPVTTLPEFIAYAKANPGKLNIASPGTGTGPHMAGELLKMTGGLDLVHVPYRGAAPALTDLIGGQVQVMVVPTAGTIEHIIAGRLRALAVTSATRSEVLPDIPTVGDFLPGYAATGWNGVCVARNTPAGIIETLNNAINAGLADPKIRARIAELGAVPMSMTPAEFGKFIADEAEKWGRVVKFSGAKLG